MNPSTASMMTEADLLDVVIEMAHLFKWTCAHFRPAKTEKGWRTPVSADGKGFPDLVLVRGERLIFAELKSETGRMSPEQDAWMDALDEVRLAIPPEWTDARIGVHVWKPRDWLNGAIEDELR